MSLFVADEGQTGHYPAYTAISSLLYRLNFTAVSHRYVLTAFPH
jgi:hypothetical protein